jgi:hypothetical protein
MDVHKKGEFLGLLQEFIEDYLHTPEGTAHIGSYERIRAEGENNFSEIVGASDRGEDVVDAVLLKLLPYTLSIRAIDLCVLTTTKFKKYKSCWV